MNGVHKYLIVANLLLISVSASGMWFSGFRKQEITAQTTAIQPTLPEAQSKEAHNKLFFAHYKTLASTQYFTEPESVKDQVADPNNLVGMEQSNPVCLNAAVVQETGSPRKRKKEKPEFHSAENSDNEEEPIGSHQTQAPRVPYEPQPAIGTYGTYTRPDNGAAGYLNQESSHVQNNTDDVLDPASLLPLTARGWVREKQDEREIKILSEELSSTTSQTTEYDEELQQAIDLSLASSTPVVLDTLVNQETVPANVSTKVRKKKKERVDEDEYLLLEAAKRSSQTTVNAAVDQDIVPASLEAGLPLNDFQREAACVSDVQDVMDDTVGSPTLAVYNGEGKSFQEFVAVSNINKCILDMLKIYIEENPSVALQAIKLNFGLTDQQLLECGKTPGEIWMHVLSTFIWQQKEGRVKAIGNGNNYSFRYIKRMPNKKQKTFKEKTVGTSRVVLRLSGALMGAGVTGVGGAVIIGYVPVLPDEFKPLTIYLVGWLGSLYGIDFGDRITDTILGKKKLSPSIEEVFEENNPDKECD
jgi:hypothetical protein